MSQSSRGLPLDEAVGRLLATGGRRDTLGLLGRPLNFQFSQTCGGLPGTRLGNFSVEAVQDKTSRFT